MLDAFGLRPALTSAHGAPVWRSRAPAQGVAAPQDLADLGIREVWDLRTPAERAASPAVQIPGAQVRHPDGPLYVVGRAGLGMGAGATRSSAVNARAEARGIPGVDDVPGAPAGSVLGGIPGSGDRPPVPGLADLELARQLRDGSLGRQLSGERMEEIYTSLAEHAATLRTVVSALVGARTPTLVFCSSGKDRTGMACYCAQLALGHGRGQAMEDYLHTNAVNARVNARDLERLAARGVPPWRLEVALSLFLAKEEYVGVFERTVQARERGGLEGYLASCRA